VRALWQLDLLGLPSSKSIYVVVSNDGFMAACSPPFYVPTFIGLYVDDESG